MEKFRIAITSDLLRKDGSLAYPDCDFALLDDNPDIEYEFLPRRKADPRESYEILASDLADFDAVLYWTEKFTTKTSCRGARLAHVQRFGAGLERIDIQACTDGGVSLARVIDGVRRPVAVMILTMILAVAGKLLVKDRIVRAGARRWDEKSDHMGLGLVGRTLGMLGVGNTGAELFRLAKPLDMQFIAYDPVVDHTAMTELGVRMVSMDELFQESDILALACPLTPETFHLVNARRLAMMKPTAFLINTARGGVVDQEALVAALKSKQIAGAGLDVLEREPPDPGEPIFELENVVLNPHALCWTDQCFADQFVEAMGSVFDVMRGRQPHGLVNKDILNDPLWRQKLNGFKQRFGS